MLLALIHMFCRPVCQWPTCLQPTKVLSMETLFRYLSTQWKVRDGGQRQNPRTELLSKFMDLRRWHGRESASSWVESLDSPWLSFLELVHCHQYPQLWHGKSLRLSRADWAGLQWPCSVPTTCSMDGSTSMVQAVEFRAHFRSAPRCTLHEWETINIVFDHIPKLKSLLFSVCSLRSVSDNVVENSSGNPPILMASWQD